MRSNLPESAVISSTETTADMISISCIGLCGGDDFRYPSLKEGKLWMGKAGGPQVEKRRYAPDNKIPSKPLKQRIDSNEPHSLRRRSGTKLPTSRPVLSGKP
jgi:hypothetical protein